MRLARALEDKKYDLRLMDKSVADKKLASKDIEAYQNALEDDAQRATTTGDIERRREERAQ